MCVVIADMAHTAKCGISYPVPRWLVFVHMCRMYRAEVLHAVLLNHVAT